MSDIDKRLRKEFLEMTKDQIIDFIINKMCANGERDELKIKTLQARLDNALELVETALDQRSRDYGMGKSCARAFRERRVYSLLEDARAALKRDEELKTSEKDVKQDTKSS